MRSAKYAILIILLLFAVIFFTEMMEKSRIHVLQYLLVGLALCLFYSLLLSISEHVGFNMAYLISAVLTIGLVGGYMLGIIKKKKPAFIMSGLLSVLYIYIFILIQLETFALLAGSLGLFVILAAVMYFSKKIDWFNEWTTGLWSLTLLTVFLNYNFCTDKSTYFYILRVRTFAI